MTIIVHDLHARQTAWIESWLLALRVYGRADATIDTYGDCARRAHRELPYGIARSTEEELLAWIFAGPSPATRKSRRAAVRSFLRWASEAGHIDFDPSSRLPSITVPAGPVRIAPQDVLDDILSRGAEPYRLWVLLAAGMGLRCVEISRLDRQHIGQTQTWIQGKGLKNQYIPTHPAVWNAAAGLPAGPIALKRDGTRCSRIDVRVRANAHIRDLGHAGVTMHMFRRWYGDRVFRASGRDIMVAKQALRHSDVKVTQRYIGTDDRDVTVAQRAIPLPV